ncbi:MAG: hypothetical protein SO006_08470 [Muribaculaceae bacterium]|nr:hypothetical protein [Muribaculaceae bacterium]
MKHKKFVLLFNLHTEMKKLFLSFAVLAGLSMISCGNKDANADAAAANDSVVTEEVAVEEVATVDSAAAPVDSAAAPVDSVAK